MNGGLQQSQLHKNEDGTTGAYAARINTDDDRRRTAVRVCQRQRRSRPLDRHVNRVNFAIDAALGALSASAQIPGDSVHCVAIVGSGLDLFGQGRWQRFLSTADASTVRRDRFPAPAALVCRESACHDSGREPAGERTYRHGGEAGSGRHSLRAQLPVVTFANVVVRGNAHEVTTSV